MTEATKKSKKIFKIKEKYLKRGGYIALGIIAFIFLFYLFNFRDGLSNSNNDWGTFGDYFGGVLNPILSFLAFIALLYTIKIQQDALSITHEELELTREELKLSRQEMEKSSKSLDEQSKSLSLQSFENTFFKLIENHKTSALNLEIVERSNLAGGKVIQKITKGKECFVTYFNYLKNYNIDDTSLNFEFTMQDDSIVKYKKLLKRFFKEKDIAYYFKEQLDLIDLILSNENKRKGSFSFYSNILKRQYSSAEYFFFFLYHMALNEEKYIDFLKRTAFFDDLPLRVFNKNSMAVIMFFGKLVYGDKFEKEVFQKELKDNEA